MNRTMSIAILFAFVLGWVWSTESLYSGSSKQPMPPRHLGRGVVALHQGNGQVFVSWRLLGTDPDEIAFNLYRVTGDALPLRVNATPIAGATCYVDTGIDTT